MTPREIIILALICFAIIGMASAAAPPKSATPAEAPSDDIGTTDGNDDAAPVGGPVPSGAFSGGSGESPSGEPGSGASPGLQVSIIAGVGATAAAAAFLF